MLSIALLQPRAFSFYCDDVLLGCLGGEGSVSGYWVYAHD